MYKLKDLLTEKQRLNEFKETQIIGIQQALAALYPGQDILGKWGVDGKLGTTTLNAIQRALKDYTKEKGVIFGKDAEYEGIPTEEYDAEKAWNEMPQNIRAYFDSKIDGGASREFAYMVVKSDKYDTDLDFGNTKDGKQIIYKWNWQISSGDSFITDTGITGRLSYNMKEPNNIIEVDSNAPNDPEIQETLPTKSAAGMQIDNSIEALPPRDAKRVKNARNKLNLFKRNTGPRTQRIK